MLHSYVHLVGKSLYLYGAGPLRAVCEAPDGRVGCDAPNLDGVEGVDLHAMQRTSPAIDQSTN